jgi:hypothetical protein
MVGRFVTLVGMVPSKRVTPMHHLTNVAAAAVPGGPVIA